MNPRVVIAAALAAAALGAGAVWAASPFPDVPEDHPRAEAIRYAKDEGLFLGFPDGNLRPDDELTEGQFIRTAERLYERRDTWTRADWAQVLFRGLPSLAAPSAASGASDAPFPDVPADHPRAEAIRYAKAEGLFLGYPDGTLRPDTNLSGGQFTKTAERLYARYDVWTRADWAQVLFGGLPSLAPAATPATTAAPVTSATPIVTPPAPPPRRPSPPPATAAPTITTTTAAPAPTTTFVEARRDNENNILWVLSYDRDEFIVHWRHRYPPHGWQWRQGWENIDWRWRIVSPDAECFAQWGVPEVADNPGVREYVRGRWRWGAQGGGEIDDGLDRVGPWSPWIRGVNYVFHEDGECPTSYYYVEIEWANETTGWQDRERSFRRTWPCQVVPLSAVDTANERVIYGFHTEETRWRCHSPYAGHFEHQTEERAGDEPARFRIFKPVPERLGFTDSPEPDSEGNRRPWCTGTYPELTLVGVRRTYKSGPFDSIHLCWDAAGNEYVPIGEPRTRASLVSRLYSNEGRLASWSPNEEWGSEAGWGAYGGWHALPYQDGYVYRNWVIARTPEGEVSRTLRYDIYDDGTYGVVECDHLVLC